MSIAQNENWSYLGHILTDLAEFLFAGPVGHGLSCGTTILKRINNTIHFRDIDELRAMIEEEKFDAIIDHCSELIKTRDDKTTCDLAKLLRATFYILNRQQPEAMTDFTSLIEDDECGPKIRSNALIKRASLFIQQCKDPQQDPIKAMADFTRGKNI